MPKRPTRSAFLLSQLGTVAATRFAELTRDVGLSPSDAGVVRIVARTPGISQRDLAARLRIVPSRVVVLIDSLEQRGLVARTRSATDRRTIELRLTDAGETAMRALRRAAERHEDIVVAGLDDTERVQLHDLLAKLAAAHGLDAEVHPGYSARSDTSE